MKKIVTLTMVALLLLGMLTFNVSAQENVSVYIDGTKIEFDVQPQIINGRTLVPMRKIFEELGAVVDWKQTTQTITGKKEDTTIIMQIDNNELSVNDNVTTLDVAPIVIDGRTLVPVRAIAESFGIDVLWYGDIETVAIYSDKDSIEKKSFYNLKGESVEIDANFEKNYLSLGWSSDIGKIETVCMYAPDGRTKYVYIGNVATEIDVGWYTEPFVTMYSLDGRTQVVKKSEVEANKNVGWYEAPVIEVYANDGRSTIIYQSELSAYESVGWSRYKLTIDDAEALRLAKDGYIYVKSILKNPNSIQLHAAYAGYVETSRGVWFKVLLDVSAMNGFGGYTRDGFRVWYSPLDGTVLKETKASGSYTVNDFINGYYKTIDINKVIK